MDNVLFKADEDYAGKSGDRFFCDPVSTKPKSIVLVCNEAEVRRLRNELLEEQSPWQ